MPSHYDPLQFSLCDAWEMKSDAAFSYMNLDSVIDQLRPMSQKIDRRQRGNESWWVITFPASQDADYRFCAYVYDDGEAGISAVRTGAADREYFWGFTFEAPDFDSVEEIGPHLIDTVTCLLLHDTRIVQSVGSINVGFECAYLENAAWHSIGGNAALRFSNFVFPVIDGKEIEYRAPAIRSS